MSDSHGGLEFLPGEGDGVSVPMSGRSDVSLVGVVGVSKVGFGPFPDMGRTESSGSVQGDFSFCLSNE